MCAVEVPPGTGLVHFLNTPKTLLFFMIQDAADPAPASAPSPVSAARAHPLAVPPLISSLQQSLCPRYALFSNPRLSLSSSLHASRPHRLPAQPVASSSSLLTPRTCPPWHQLPVFWRLVCTSASGHISSLCPHSTCSSSTPSHPKGLLPPAPAGQLDPEHQHRA